VWFLSDGIAEDLSITKSNIIIDQSDLSYINKSLKLIGPLYDSHSKEQVTLATLKKYYFRKDSLIERLTIDL
jgi:carbamate kinase